MKNVVGLASAMRLVESACENGEITIIGQGGMPTPVGLLDKCVKFINKQYGVDVLSLLMETALRKECGDLCCDCCCDDDDDEDEDTIEFDVSGVEKYLSEKLPELMPYLDDDYIRTVISLIEDYCDEHNADDTVGTLCHDTIIGDITEILADELTEISWQTCNDVAKVLGEYIGDHYVLM
jgi:hypothetical protein